MKGINPEPDALRQSAQQQKPANDGSPSASYRNAPQRQPPVWRFPVSFIRQLLFAPQTLGKRAAGANW
jgi:hypothetical protein